MTAHILQILKSVKKLQKDYIFIMTFEEDPQTQILLRNVFVMNLSCSQRISRAN